jgi:uncharacterized surface protein with fasciclin (FAS1) repeats
MLNATTFACLLACSLALAPAQPHKPGPKDTKKDASPAAAATLPDLIALATSDKDLSTFVSAVQAAGLTEALKAKGPFTVFAPTNAAFDKLGKEALADLLKPENKGKLADILKLHVIPASVPAGELVKAKDSSKTLLGQSLMVMTKDGKVQVGTETKSMATITSTDVKASNGLVHKVDTVIMPRVPEPKKEPAKKDEKGK